jgi:three-Cys-motif partner protein
MSKITSTIWEIEPHTEAKHAILKKYLDAWFPIITRWSGRVLFIDGFAGPGEYIGGKIGSPIIALNAAKERKIPITDEVIFYFIEADYKRCEYLKDKLAAITLPSNIKYECVCGKFDETIKGMFDYLDEQKARIAPSFVFIDPFGFTGIPFALIKRIMENAKCEVLITFMYEEINRFVSDEKLWEQLNATFGTDKWKQVLTETDPRKREEILHNVYFNQLKHEAGIKYVKSFKMINKSNKTDYYLFFGTNHPLGLEKMKEAMWAIDEKGLFQFSDATYNPDQAMLFTLEPNFQALKSLIVEKYEGKTISVSELENFIITSTPFLHTHYKRQILVPMEKASPAEINVSCPDKTRRRGTYPLGCLIEFK